MSGEIRNGEYVDTTPAETMMCAWCLRQVPEHKLEWVQEYHGYFCWERAQLLKLNRIPRRCVTIVPTHVYDADPK